VLTLNTMYPGIAYSPETELAQPINATATSIEVLDPSVFPPAPNIAVIGDIDVAETIIYNSIAANILGGCQRGVQAGGVGKAWNAGANISRQFTELDYRRFIENINILNNGKLDSAAVTNNLTSLSITDALSAAMGRVLNENKMNVDVAVISSGDITDIASYPSGLYNITSAVTGLPYAQWASAFWLRQNPTTGWLEIADRLTPGRRHYRTLQAGTWSSWATIWNTANFPVEEGTFVPAFAGGITAGTPTYTTQLGRYYRTGKLVFVSINLALSSLGGADGRVEIRNLPFNMANWANIFQQIQMWGTRFVYPAAAMQPIISGVPNNNYLTGSWVRDNNIPTDLLVSHLVNNSAIYINGVYIMA